MTPLFLVVAVFRAVVVTAAVVVGDPGSVDEVSTVPVVGVVVPSSTDVDVVVATLPVFFEPPPQAAAIEATTVTTASVRQ